MTPTAYGARRLTAVAVSICCLSLTAGCGLLLPDDRPDTADFEPRAAASSSPTADAGGFRSPNPPAKAAPHRRDFPTAEETFPSDPWGILNDPEAPAHGWQFTAGNRWHGRVDGREVNVYAGAAGFEHPRTGAVMVLWSRLGSGEALGSKTLTQAGSGPLMIVAADGDRLTVWDSHGYRHYLQLSSSDARLTGPIGDPVAIPATGPVPAVSSACDNQLGAVVTITVGPDTPGPRCAKVFADQALRIVNGTNQYGQPGQPVTVTFPTLPTATLQVGEARTFPGAFAGLAPGVHPLKLSVFAGGGAEMLVR